MLSWGLGVIVPGTSAERKRKKKRTRMTHRYFICLEFFSDLGKMETAEEKKSKKKKRERGKKELITVFSQVTSAWCDQSPPRDLIQQITLLLCCPGQLT